MATFASAELDDLSPAPRFPTKVFEGHTKSVYSVAYFHDGKYMISGSHDKTVRIWNVESRKQEGESPMHDFKVESMALSPDERRLVSGGNGVVLWDLEGRTVVWKKEASEAEGCVAYSPDGQLIAARHQTAIIVLLGAETGERIQGPLQLSENVWCLAFSPDGTQLAAGSHKGNVRVLDVATGETVVGPFKAHRDGVISLVYTSDGQQFITASADKSIRVWNAVTSYEIGSPMLGHEDWVRQIALSRDGQRLASASDDSTVRVWDRKTRRQIGGPLQAQDSRDIYSVAWSPDGRSIVAGHSGDTIYQWDAPSLDDHPVILQAPAPTSPSALLSTSRTRENSISSSILNLPAGSQSSNQTLATDKLPDDFFDSSPDLPSRAHNQISTIPIAAVPLGPSIPSTTKLKSGPKIPSTAASSPSNLFGRVGSRFRRDRHAPEAIGMQPPSHKVPKYSPVGKVALGQADKRLYMDESKDKKPGDEEQEVLEDIDINCWEFFCAMIESCFSCCSNPDAHPQPPCHAAPQPSGHAAPQSSGRATPASSHYAMPTSSHYAMPTSSGYAMPTSPGPAAEQLDQNIRWTG